MKTDGSLNDRADFTWLELEGDQLEIMHCQVAAREPTQVTPSCRVNRGSEAGEIFPGLDPGKHLFSLVPVEEQNLASVHLFGCLRRLGRDAVAHPGSCTGTRQGRQERLFCIAQVSLPAS